MNSKSKTKNPVVLEVLEKFESIYRMTKIFASENGSAMNGLLISGDAGTGKTHWVKRALEETTDPSNIEYIKGASISAAAIYVKMYLSRRPGQILVLDDVDIIHKTGGELSTILDLFKGATELTKGERMISWEKAGANLLMKELNVPSTFDFQGSIIWITNDTLSRIEAKSKGHWGAISSRFNQQKIQLNDQEKVLYTLYLIEEEDMLGKDCMAKEGGFTPEIIDMTTEYIRKNYKNLKEITPRISVKIADLITTFPNEWESMCNNQLLN